MTQIKQATRELAPAVLDLGGCSARHETFLADFRGTGRDRALVLRPIATDGLPPRLERVRLVVHGGYDFTLHGGPALVGPGEVSIPLRTVRTAPIPEGRRIPRQAPTDPRVLVIPQGGDDLDLYAMPIIDVSRDGCAVESSHALPPGEQLASIELWGDRRLLRRAHARVLESIPWRTPNGDRRFRIRLSLSAADHSEARHAELLSDPARIRRLVEVASLLGTEVRFELPGGSQVRGRMTDAAEDVLTVEVEATSLVAPRVRLMFELFSVSYAMNVRAIRWSTSERTVALALPLVVQRRQRRYHFRAPVPEEMRLKLRAHNPATGQRLSREVRDLSFGGLSFELDPSSDALWQGLTLEKASLASPHGIIPLGELEIRHVDDDDTCRVELRARTAVDTPAFVDLMARLRYPQMRVCVGDDFDSMIRLYEEVGLFGPHMTRNLPAVRDEAKRVWQKLHQTDLCRTLVQREGDRPVAAVSAVRAWEQSWVIQHMVAAPTRRRRDPGILHMAYLDYVLPRPDGRYMVVFVHTENRRITTFLERFFQLTGTPEAIARREVGLWVLRGDPTDLGHPPAPDLVVRPLRRRDERVAQRASERIFGRLGAAALALREGEFRIPESTKSLAREGIHRGRRNRIITDRGYPLLAMVEELADPGFNLTWLINATWVLPIHTESRGSDALRVAAHHIATRAVSVGAGERLVMIPTGTDTSAFEAVGFEHEADVAVHSYNRAGLHRWYYYIRERYGEIRARKRADLLARGA